MNPGLVKGAAGMGSAFYSGFDPLRREAGWAGPIQLCDRAAFSVTGCSRRADAPVVGGCAVTGYNRAIRLDETVKQSWAQVENILQSRYDLVPNLVETVKGYAQHEKEIFVSVADARARYIEAVRGGTQSDRIDAANRFEMALRPVLALQENYPELRAQESFARLMDALEGTERRLAVERKRYNDTVATLNAYARGLVGRTFAGWAGVSEATYFEVAPEAREAPRVRFGTDPADEP